MRIMIDIPEEFICDYESDRFEDCLQRFICDTKKEGMMAGNYERETAEMLIKAFKDAKEVSRCKDCDNLGEWVPIKTRPMTEEEKEAWAEYGDYIFDCPMPADGQLIWVTSKCGNLWQDTCEDDGGLLYLEGNGDWDDIVAWMPVYKPEPYKEAE